ncbi:MAG TPA: alpha/beta hydrolase [Gaiellaceae bacterium]
MLTVLVHGLGVSHRYFARLRPLLPGAAAPDLAGDSVQALSRSLELVTPPRSLLVANSLGCQVAAELAVRRPDLVAALVLVGPTWDPSAPTLAAQLVRLCRGAFREDPSLLALIVSDYVRWGPRRMLRCARSMLRDPAADRLAAVRAPVVVVRGEHDSVCGPAWARLAAAVAHGRLVEAAGAGHAVHWSRPEVVAEAVQELLQDLPEA